jgi:glycosyltransferase involved in cell wall biosynthesis
VKTAIVHYWLVNMRGGEKMLEALLELFPGADLFTHVYDPRAMPESIRSRRVYTSAIQKLPLATKLYQVYMPLMPRALLDFDLQDYDLVISSEAGPAKGVVPRPGAYHLCYCHSPMRYIWDMYHAYGRASGVFKRFFMRALVPSLRVWDITSANLVDRFVTNSNYTAARIRRYYNREAAVVFGPVEVEPFFTRSRSPQDFYLFFGQLTEYKRADLAIEACVSSGRKLVVAGAGAQRSLIRRYGKGGLVRFTGRVSEEAKGRLFSQARALLYPGIEDLGLIPIEATAAGCPVIAYRGGGALDTIREGLTGVFFDEQSPRSLREALDAFEAEEGRFSSREAFTAQARNFSKEAFKERISRIVSEGRRV